MHDISGNAHFINKCDNGIVIHRNRDPESGPIDLVQVQLQIYYKNNMFLSFLCTLVFFVSLLLVGMCTKSEK